MDFIDHSTIAHGKTILATNKYYALAKNVPHCSCTNHEPDGVNGCLKQAHRVKATFAALQIKTVVLVY